MTDDPTRTADYGYFPWERDSIDTDDLAQRRSEETMQREVDDKYNWQTNKPNNWIKD